MLKTTDLNENNFIYDECIFVVGFPQKCIKTSGVQNIFITVSGYIYQPVDK